MDTRPVIKSITIYPVKSLDGIVVQKVQIGNGGSLVHDREYAICDENGKYVNGKSNAGVHLLRSDFDPEQELIAFRHETAEDWHSFHINNDKALIDEYLSGFFNMPVKLLKDTNGRFLDIPVKSGITIISQASLETVSDWFSGMPVEETKARFRANLEITGVPAFWEDRLFFEEGTAVEFKIGETILYGLSPRARCIVPTRHPQTGEAIHAFQRSFSMQRAANLPNWSTMDNFGHTYHLSTDCYIPPSEFGKWINTGDEIKIIGKKILA